MLGRQIQEGRVSRRAGPGVRPGLVRFPNRGRVTPRTQDVRGGADEARGMAQ